MGEETYAKSTLLLTRHEIAEFPSERDDDRLLRKHAKVFYDYASSRVLTVRAGAGNEQVQHGAKSVAVACLSWRQRST